MGKAGEASQTKRATRWVVEEPGREAERFKLSGVLSSVKLAGFREEKRKGVYMDRQSEKDVDGWRKRWKWRLLHHGLRYRWKRLAAAVKTSTCRIRSKDTNPQAARATRVRYVLLRCFSLNRFKYRLAPTAMW